ncbi:MAG: copper resistance CopC family protein, partial [Methylocella sp.]
PGVGMTVSGPVRELRLYFTQGVVTAFSHVHVVSAAGANIPVSKPVNDPSDQQTVIIRLGRALGPGTYSLSWLVVSVDTHTTQGTFTFTVS